MQIIGYKCFNEDLTNRYGTKFEVGKIYIAQGAIKFGNNGNGFHLCKNIEDTFRYFDAMEGTVSICQVKGSGEMVSYFDDYYGYYDMYAVEKLEILKLLTREEIVGIGLSIGYERVKRFIAGFKLNQEEIEAFKNKYFNNPFILSYIAYYQENDKDAFTKEKRY